VPLRRCAGCGRAAAKTELVRLALTRSPPQEGQARIVLDRGGSLGGRGAYLCRQRPGDLPSASCLTLARSRQSLARTLRVAVPIDPELVESVLG
jgi:predicted RNA-binding protein YlxR (DUF448 family)